MVVIDKEKCTACGSCVKICHEHCMSLKDGTIAIDYANCSTCTQCIGICPQKALSWNGILPADYDPALLPTVLQVDELLKQRRTIRHFSDKCIDRVTLEEVVSCGVYSPTHNFDLRCIVIDDSDATEEFDKAAFRFSDRIYRRYFRPWPIRVLVTFAPRPLREQFHRTKPKLEAAIARGRAYGSRPAALVLVVGDARVPFSLESAQYALYNMSLYAQVKGLGCRNLVGNQMIFNKSRTIRQRLSLGAHERIFGIIGLGYPSVRFRNKVLGKKMRVQWNGDRVAAR